MKTKTLFLFIFFPLFLFGQSSATDSFELNLTLNRSIQDFENINIYYIAGTGIQTSNFKIDSLENANNLSHVKLFGTYHYIGGANAVFPTFILSENKVNHVQHYLIRVRFSAQKKSQKATDKPTIEFIPVVLNPSQPFIEISREEGESIFIRNYKFLAELQSIQDNEYLFIDLFNWIKIESN